MTTATIPTRRQHRIVAKPLPLTVSALLVMEVDKDGTDVEICKPCMLPFLPRAHDELGVGADGDYITVDTVYWCEEDGVTVWFVTEDAPHTYARMIKDGWKERYPP